MSGLPMLASKGSFSEVGPKNLALSGMGAQAKSWAPNGEVITGHEPSKAIEGSFHTLGSTSLCLTCGSWCEVAQSRTVSYLVLGYFDGRIVRGPVVARTQQWARLQYWNQEEWKDLDPKVLGQETSSVR